MKKENVNVTSVTEFDIMVKAKAGDRASIEWLWDKYKPLMIARVMKWRGYYPHIEPSDVEGELFEALLHELTVIKPELITKPRDEWTFFYEAAKAAGHYRNRLKTQVKRERNILPYDENDIDHDTVVSRSVQIAYSCNEHIFTDHNPENETIRNTELSIGNKREWMDAELSDFQKAVLRLKRAGMSIAEVADRMGCSRSRVNVHLRDAWNVASYIFDIPFHKINPAPDR